MARNLPQGRLAAECPHVHFKTSVIDRNILTKRQHLNLLCTPRGYRWEVAIVKGEDERLVCSSKPCEKPPRAYVYNLLSDLWSVVTPETVNKLQAMMMMEFGMSKEEAADFVCGQMKEMTKMVEMNRRKGSDLPSNDQQRPAFISDDVQRARCRCQMAVNVKQRIVKNMADVLAGKLAEAAAFMTVAKKGHRQRRMSEVLLNGFCRLSGENFNPNEPRSKFHKLQVFLADKMAMWLAKNIVEERSELAKNRKKEDEKIRDSALKRAKEYDKKIRERAALARKIEIQKIAAQVREEEAKRKEEEATTHLEESWKKKVEEIEKKDEVNAMLKEKSKKKNKVKERDDTKNKRDARTLIGDITAKADRKTEVSKKKKQATMKPKTATKPAGKPVESGGKESKGKKVMKSTGSNAKIAFDSR